MNYVLIPNLLFFIEPLTLVAAGRRRDPFTIAVGVARVVSGQDIHVRLKEFKFEAGAALFARLIRMPNGDAHLASETGWERHGKLTVRVRLANSEGRMFFLIVERYRNSSTAPIARAQSFDIALVQLPLRSLANNDVRGIFVSRVPYEYSCISQLSAVGIIPNVPTGTSRMWGALGMRRIDINAGRHGEECTQCEHSFY